MFKYTENHVPRQQQDVMRGWWCILGVSLVFIFNVSLIPTFGMMFEPFFDGNIKTATIVMYLFLFLSNLTIIATGFLLKDLSAKHFVMIGSSLTFLGLLTSSFVTSPTHLIYTFSVLTGVGLGMLNPAAFVAVLSCFTCQRVHAISLGFAALGLGQMIMPMIVKQLIANYGFRSTALITSGLSLIGLLGGNFLVPIKWKPCVRLDAEMQPLVVEKQPRQPNVIFKEIIQATDLDLLSNLKYLVLIFGLCIVFASSLNFNIIFPVYLQKQVDYDTIQINNCIFTITVSDIISRLAYPLVLKTLNFSSRYAVIFGVVGLAIIRLVFLHMDLENYKLLLIFCAVLGFFRAITVVNQVLVLVDFCEENCPTKLPGTLGLSVIIKAVGVLFFGWIFNGLWQVFAQLYMNFYFQIILFIILIVLWVLEDEPRSPLSQHFFRIQNF